MDVALGIVRRIIASVDLPVSVDFEAGYAETPTELSANVARLLDAGAVGLNLEDRLIRGVGMRDIPDQMARLQSIKTTAIQAGVSLFINARTDLFLQSSPELHPKLLGDALEREAAYAKAGADGFFVPGLVDPELVGKLAASSKLPLNVMMKPELGGIKNMAGLGKELQRLLWSGLDEPGLVVAAQRYFVGVWS